MDSPACMWNWVPWRRATSRSPATKSGLAYRVKRASGQIWTRSERGFHDRMASSAASTATFVRSLKTGGTSPSSIAARAMTPRNPAASIAAPWTATAPSSISSRVEFMVTTVPPRTISETSCTALRASQLRLMHRFSVGDRAHILSEDQIDSACYHEADEVGYVAAV